MPVNAAMHRIIYLFGLTGLLTAYVQPVSACRCTPPPLPGEALHASSAVFEGTALELSTVDGRAFAQFKVTRAWKGVPSEHVRVSTASTGASCGVSFETGQSYLVYASVEPDGAGELRTNLCTRTRPMEQAAEDLAALGVGAVPVDVALPKPRAAPPAPPQAGCASCTVGRPLGGGDSAALVGGLGLIAWAFRRWRR